MSKNSMVPPRARKTSTKARTAKRTSSPSRRRTSLRDQAYEAIKRRIITCEFKPGECLNESYVSGLIKVGRTPVHQAMNRLMCEDMIEVIPRKGIIVKPISLHSVIELCDVRLINDTYCTRLAAERAEPGHIEKLSDVVARARQAMVERNVREMMLLDREFHAILANAARNEELEKVTLQLIERSLRFWFITFTTPDHYMSCQEEHEAILEAVRNGDAGAAESAMRRHVDSFRKSVAQHL